MPNLIVVGGGPAGCALAIMARNFGLKVALIEAVPFPRFAPGEALPHDLETYLDMLGVTERVMERHLVYEGTRMKWGEASALSDFGRDDSGIRRQGLQIPREHLDTVLLERARSLGVAILQPCLARGLVARQGRICAVLTDRGNFSADFIVDAGGSRHWMARKLGLPIKYYSPPLQGSYGWALGEIPGYDVASIVADPLGWTWTSRVDEGLYQFTRLSFEKERLPPLWLPAELAGLTPMGRVRGADLQWRRVVHPAGPGYFLAGDALCRTDPVVQQGVFKSIVCGCKVALALDLIYNHGVGEELSREQYCQWVESSYLSDLGQLHQYYRHHPFAPEWVGNPSEPALSQAPQQDLGPYTAAWQPHPSFGGLHASWARTGKSSLAWQPGHQDGGLGGQSRVSLRCPCVPAALPLVWEALKTGLGGVPGARERLAIQLSQGFQRSPFNQLLIEVRDGEVSIDVLERRPVQRVSKHADARVLELASRCPLSQVCDLASGEGRNTLALARKGHRLLALDSCPRRLARLALRARRERLRIKTLQVQLSDPQWPIPAASQDVCLAVGMIAGMRAQAEVEHLFRESARVTRPRGRLLADVFLLDPGAQVDQLTREMAQAVVCFFLSREELRQCLGEAWRVEEEREVVAYEREQTGEGWAPPPWFEPWALGENLFPGHQAPPVRLFWVVLERV